MKEFFDTSVLVAAFLGDHPHHLPSAKLFAGADKKHSACGIHSLAEIYSSLTRIPLRPMIEPSQAILFLEDVKKKLHIVSLDETEYFDAIVELSERDFSGGQVYDALLLKCAVKSHAETIYTWNLRHFQQMSPAAAERIKSPS